MLMHFVLQLLNEIESGVDGQRFLPKYIPLLFMDGKLAKPIAARPV